MATSTEPGDSGNLAQSARAKPMDCANGKTPRSPAYPWLSHISGLLERLILLTAAERLRFSFAHALVSAGKTAGKIEFVGKEKIRWIAYDNIHPTIYKCSARASGRQKFHLKNVHGQTIALISCCR